MSSPVFASDAVAFEQFKVHLDHEINDYAAKGDKYPYNFCIALARGIFSLTSAKSIPLYVFDYLDKLFDDGLIVRKY